MSPHGEKMVELVCERDIMIPFIKLWRQHFLDTMSPKELPHAWKQEPEIYDQFKVPKPFDIQLETEEEKEKSSRNKKN